MLPGTTTTSHGYDRRRLYKVEARQRFFQHTVRRLASIAAQKRLIKDRLNAYRATHAEQENFLHRLAIKVDTVDGFQGSEADLVCYSTVRTRGALEFLLDRKRLNVACSRAKHHLVFFGDADFLARARTDAVKENYFAMILSRAHRLNVRTPARQNAFRQRRQERAVSA